MYAFFEVLQKLADLASGARGTVFAYLFHFYWFSQVLAALMITSLLLVFYCGSCRKGGSYFYAWVSYTLLHHEHVGGAVRSFS